ncbi:ATP-dependent metallopeptidase FtsH/Yme1/Tma family protein [uncultured Campylobacter sp.]|jgi:putative cell division protease ftsH-like protein|uniref:ATP-dependent metallopeptidase FtsH/Yme1/Tma family protein n=1 Tax=uncultured Campylobacter sp. TaxID=218934 RepID=UPI0025EA092E|nr:ATP-dependent metallopeptidase FtsH/Yme1/Tma family protein [uncultured Campylobacter sp.]
MRQISGLITQKFKSKKNILIVSSALLAILLIAASFRGEPKTINFSDYKQLLSQNFIDRAVIEGDEIILYAQNNRYKVVKDSVNLSELFKVAPIENKQIYVDTSEILTILIVFAAFFIILVALARVKKKEQTTELKNGEKAEATGVEGLLNSFALPVISNVSFADVAGIEDVKSELAEIVDFLKNPMKYKNFGIKMPKGVLMVGPPGVGKTLVAKAVAGEANVPFFYQNGASFVQIYVGMGAKRVRELFLKAKAYAPSIIFIDEIDAVGKSRGGGRNDEREATLNQLLTEMDGFEDNSGVIVIAATNRIEMIDEALLRSGRFDRRVFLSMPDFKDRAAILKTYLKNKRCNADVNELARLSVGFSGAALSTLVNEAAINSLRRGGDTINLSDFEAVLNKVLLGKKKVLSYSEEEKRILATYQAAKALAAYWFEVKFDKISLIEDRFTLAEREIESKTQMLSRVKVLLAGMCKLELDENDLFSNAAQDINAAKELAQKMVFEYAMGGALMPNPTDVDKILAQAKDEMTSFLRGVSPQTASVAQYLLDYESIERETIVDILNKTYE